MPKVSILSIFLYFFTCYAFAQIGGKHTYQFLNLVTSPRQAALGGKNITIYDYDPTAGMFNPANINYQMDNQLSVNYADYLGDVNYGTASYAYLLDRRTQVLHTGVTYLNYGSFDGYDEFGNATGSFSGGEAAISFGYAYNIPWSNFYIGANLKFISSKLESYSSIGIATDLGITYYYEDWDLVISAVVRNAGTQLTPYHETYEKLPLDVMFGISQQLRDVPLRWHLTLDNLQHWNIAFRNTNRDETSLDGEVTADDPGFFNNILRHAIVGVEIFPESIINLRLGYNFRRGEELRILEQRSFAGVSGGFAIKLNKLRLSYSYVKYNGAANANYFGLNIAL
ncbi:MAG: type IX secretion system protein PorQ [Mesonia hippocampi]|uniref:type IX secretion system protein PorQ n=1 Tax=Mesonia hippocampi TaxID=1628250 RepID=UPI003F949824